MQQMDHDNLRLEPPTTAREDSYRALLRDFLVHGEPLIPFTLEFSCEDFPAFVARLHACARGEGLPPGFVPHSTWWLVRAGDEVVGVSNLRHALTPRLRVEGGNIGYGVRPNARRRGYATALLRGTLERARELGLNEALLTCAKDNAASVATIRKCGGRFDSEEFIPERKEVVQRYWIDLGSAA
jgi:predicted acetyltransferase